MFITGKIVNSQMSKDRGEEHNMISLFDLGRIYCRVCNAFLREINERFLSSSDTPVHRLI